MFSAFLFSITVPLFISFGYPITGLIVYHLSFKGVSPRLPTRLGHGLRKKLLHHRRDTFQQMKKGTVGRLWQRDSRTLLFLLGAFLLSLFWPFQVLAKPAKKTRSSASSGSSVLRRVPSTSPEASLSLPGALAWVMMQDKEPNTFHFGYVVSAKSPILLMVETVAQDEEGNLLKAVTQPIVKVSLGVKAPGRYFWTWKAEGPLICPVFYHNGLRKDASAHFLCFTVLQTSPSARSLQRLYFPPQVSKAGVTLIPQEGESVTRLNEEVLMGVALKNPASSLARYDLSYDLRTEASLKVSGDRIPVAVPGGSTVVTLMKLGKATLPGPLKLTVSLEQGGRKVSSDQQLLATAPPSVEIFAPDAPIGIANGDLSLSERLGVKWWLGPWPFWDSSGQGDWVDPRGGGFTSREFFASAEKRGLFVISLLDLDGQWKVQTSALTRAMQDFIRKPGAWIYILPSPLPEEDILLQRIEAFYHLAKSIHKESVAGVLCDPPLYSQLVLAGGLDNTDVIILTADTPQVMIDSSQRFSSLRDERIPGKSLWWLVKEEERGPQSAQALVKASVLALANGFERIFLKTQKPHLASIGLGTLSYYLTGAEFVGRLSSPPEVFAYLFLKRGEPIVIAWAEVPTPVALSLPLGQSLEARDVYFSRATFARIQGNKVWLTQQPIFITSSSPQILPFAKGTFEQEYQTLTQKMAQLGITVPAGWQWGSTPNEWYQQRLTDLVQWMVGHRGEDHTLALVCFSHLLRLWDGEGFVSAVKGVGKEISAKKALDGANRAIADLRAEIYHQESSSGYFKEVRLLLRMIEKRLSLGRMALRQGDFALAQARGEQVALSARHLGPLLEKEKGVRPGEVVKRF